MKETNSVAPAEDIVDAQGKAFYRSKTLWVNVIGALALLVQQQWGFVVSVETQALLLSMVNLGLRAVTDRAVVW